MKRWQPAEKPQPERDSNEGEGEMVGQSDTGPSDAFTFWLLDPPARMVLHSCTCICSWPGNPWARQRHSFLTTLLQCSETLGYEGLRFRPPTYHTSVPTLPNTSNPGPTSPVVFRCVRTTARVSPLSRDGQQPSACPASSGSSEQEGHLDPRPQVITQSPSLHNPSDILFSTTRNFFRFQRSVVLLFFLVCLWVFCFCLAWVWRLFVYVFCFGFGDRVSFGDRTGWPWAQKDPPASACWVMDERSVPPGWAGLQFVIKAFVVFIKYWPS